MAYCDECGERITDKNQKCWETGGTCYTERRSEAPSSGTVRYKGRTYRLVWQGRTKYGDRAHLAFLDGSKDFWVDSKQLN